MILSEDDWQTLLTRIKGGKCTPFLGAAVNHGILPLGGEIAGEWADANGYPLDSRTDLAKVSQFLAIKSDAARPKEMMLEKLDRSQKPFNFNDEDEPLNVLARLPIPVYLTTNYDSLLRAGHQTTTATPRAAAPPSTSAGGTALSRRSRRCSNAARSSRRARRRRSSTTCTAIARSSTRSC